MCYRMGTGEETVDAMMVVVDANAVVREVSGDALMKVGVQIEMWVMARYDGLVGVVVMVMQESHNRWAAVEVRDEMAHLVRGLMAYHVGDFHLYLRVVVELLMDNAHVRGKEVVLLYTARVLVEVEVAIVVVAEVAVKMVMKVEVEVVDLCKYDSSEQVGHGLNAVEVAAPRVAAVVVVKHTSNDLEVMAALDHV